MEIEVKELNSAGRCFFIKNENMINICREIMEEIQITAIGIKLDAWT